jgi:hypothetical protein
LGLELAVVEGYPARTFEGGLLCLASAGLEVLGVRGGVAPGTHIKKTQTKTDQAKDREVPNRIRPTPRVLMPNSPPTPTQIAN